MWKMLREYKPLLPAPRTAKTQTPVVQRRNWTVGMGECVDSTSAGLVFNSSTSWLGTGICMILVDIEIYAGLGRGPRYCCAQLKHNSSEAICGCMQQTTHQPTQPNSTQSQEAVKYGEAVKERFSLVSITRSTAWPRWKGLDHAGEPEKSAEESKSRKVQDDELPKEQRHLC